MHSRMMTMLAQLPKNAVPVGYAKASERPAHPTLHHHSSRRHFLQIGASLVGAAASFSVLGGTAFAARPGSGLPKPQPSFSPFVKSLVGVEIPWFLAFEVDPFTSASPVADASTIGDFNGSLGLVEANGVNDPANSTDGEARRWELSLRFMKGVFADRGGRIQRGAFSFL